MENIKYKKRQKRGLVTEKDCIAFCKTAYLTNVRLILTWKRGCFSAWSGPGPPSYFNMAHCFL